MASKVKIRYTPYGQRGQKEKQMEREQLFWLSDYMHTELGRYQGDHVNKFRVKG